MMSRTRAPHGRSLRESSTRTNSDSTLNELRRLAQHIDASEPAWHVMFGPASWMFWAFPCWPAPNGLLVAAYRSDELIDRMRDAELRHAPWQTAR